MKSAFDANVSRRRPRTAVQSDPADEPTAAPGTPSEESAVAPPVGGPVAEAPKATAAALSDTKAPAGATPERAELDPDVVAKKLRAHMRERRERAKAPEGPFVEDTAQAAAREALQAIWAKNPNQTPQVAAQDRLEALRDRLENARESEPDDEKPMATAEAMRRIVEGLRGRLQKIAEERESLTAALEHARAERERDRQSRIELEARLHDAEARSLDRTNLAEELLGEVELTVGERDQALARLAELRFELERQAALLCETRAALAERERKLELQAVEVAGLKTVLDAQADEVERQGTLLARRTAERDALLERNTELEAEVQRNAESKKALHEIGRLVRATRMDR